MNDDLIYRKDAIRETWREPTYSDPLNVLTEMRDRLEALPSAEPERKTGRWIIDHEYIDCSNCHREKWSKVPYENLVKWFRYCPNCGAYMKGAREPQ